MDIQYSRGEDSPMARKKATTKHGRAHNHVNGRMLSGHQWSQLRKRWEDRLPQPCPRCGHPVNRWDAWDLDHVGIPHALADGTNDDVRPAHSACNKKAGGELSAAISELGKRIARGETITEPRLFLEARTATTTNPEAEKPPGFEDDFEPDPVTPGPTDSIWDGSHWLAELRDIPPNATWPRLMSLPHPDAVGSYGPDAVRWINAMRGTELRWWQRLTLYRMLEFDSEGLLVWMDVIASTARQVGKSVLLRELALWRLHSAGLFGEEQLLMHTGKNIPICREVQRPARMWARDREEGYTVLEGLTREEIGTPDGSRWILRAANAVYGYAVTMGLVDEAWAVRPSSIEDGLEPTLTERANAQLVMFSTAHRQATALIPLRRAGVMAAWGSPSVRTLLVEWSAARDSAFDDRDSWRAASPHFTPGRLRLLESKLARAQAGHSADPDEDDAVESFRSQFLNVWPVRSLVTSAKTEPLADRNTWGQAADLWAAPIDGNPVTVAVEDYFGLGAAGSAVTELDDGRLLVWGGLFASRSDAYAWAGFTVGTRPDSRVIVGASLSAEEAAKAIPRAVAVDNASAAYTGSALSLMRSMLRAGRLVHSGDDDLAGQVRSVQLVPTSSGGLGVAHRGVRSDFLRAAAWALADRARPVSEPMGFYVY